MIYISFMRSRGGAIADAKKHGLTPLHVYDIRKYEGKGNYIIDDSECDTKGTFACFGLRWFLLRGLVANIPPLVANIPRCGSDAIVMWNIRYDDNISR